MDYVCTEKTTRERPRPAVAGYGGALRALGGHCSRRRAMGGRGEEGAGRCGGRGARAAAVVAIHGAALARSTAGGTAGEGRGGGATAPVEVPRSGDVER